MLPAQPGQAAVAETPAQLSARTALLPIIQEMIPSSVLSFWHRTPKSPGISRMTKVMGAPFVLMRKL